MSDNNQDKDFDLAAFLLTGNIMVTLVEKGVIDMREAYSIIRETQSALKNSELYKKEIDETASDYIDRLFTLLWDAHPRPYSLAKEHRPDEG